MSDQYSEDEELRRQRWAERRARMRREKERREKLNRIAGKGILYGGCVLCLAAGLGIGSLLQKWQKAQDGHSMRMGRQTAGEDAAESLFIGGIDKAEYTPEPEETAAHPAEVADGWVQVGDVRLLAELEARIVSTTADAGEPDVLSDHAMLINESTNEIVAQKNAQVTINPASMTKIMTILVAAEHVTDLEDEVAITVEMTDYAYVNDSSTAGFEAGDVVTVRDLFYGTILPSGGEAALALAEYVAGSQEEFVKLMNGKLEELGLSDTAHFTNCIGLYDQDHYCLVSDMAMILKTALEDDWCREVLSAHIYTTSPTGAHPEGLTISNWFLRRIEDKDTGGEVLCAKTGYVDESRSCAASYFVSDSGIPYICVTAGAHSSWRCIYDHVAMYSLYAE